MSRPTDLEIHITGKPAPQGSKMGIAIKAEGKYTGKVAQGPSAKISAPRRWRPPSRPGGWPPPGQ